MQADSRSTAGPSLRVGWATVAVLFVFSVFAMIDRQILTMMVDPIRRDLGISDVQASLLLGFSFALFYTTFGLMMGWMADRFERRIILAVSVALWGLASAACGLAETFGELFAARILVGVGEAALGPAAYSMISDAFPKHRLALAMSVYIMGGLVGGAIAITTGGFLIDWSAQHGAVVLPLIGEVGSWRLVFLATGLPGPLIAMLAFLVPEPVRTGLGKKDADGRAPRLFDYLKRHAILFAWLCVGFGGLSMIVNSTFSWSPSILSRTLGVSPSSIGLIIAALLIFAGLPGQIASGVINDKAATAGKTGFYLRWFVFVVPVGAVGAVFALLANDLTYFILGMIPLYFFVMPFLGIASTVIQLFTPNEFRGRVSALFIMLVTLIGFGAGPTLVASISTALDPTGQAIGTALAVTIAMAAVVSVGCLMLVTPRFRRTVRQYGV